MTRRCTSSVKAPSRPHQARPRQYLGPRVPVPLPKLRGRAKLTATERRTDMSNGALDNDPLRRATGTIGSQIASAMGMVSGSGELAPY